MTTITTAARRIARTLNAYRCMGGKCVFHADGSGGAWYDNNSNPPLKGDAAIFDVPGTRRVTAREIQERLDAA